MPDLDQETAALAKALVYRLRNRGDGEGQYATDDDLPTGSGEPPEDVRRELDGLRARLSGKEA